MPYDYNRPFVKRSDLCEYLATNRTVSKRYGPVVMATDLSNKKYKIRFDKMHNEHRMRAPPSSDRIFSGYLVVRNLGTPHEYETWIPDQAFEDIYGEHVP